jgi:hypothetical protein
MLSREENAAVSDAQRNSLIAPYSVASIDVDRWQCGNRESDDGITQVTVSGRGD